jgi:hypothetical protein
MAASLCDVLFDSSYPTGGEAVDPSAVGLSAILAAIDTRSGVADGPYAFKYNRSTGKMQAFRSGGSPIEAYSPGGGDIKGSKTTDVGIASGALQTNGNLLVTLADAANTTTMTIALQPDVGRNVGLAFKNTNVGASTGNAISCVITGTFRGVAQTETISFTALELTSTAQNEVATKYGVKPFDTITSITKPTAQPSGWQAGAGPGSKIGLPTATATNAEADLIKLTKNGADLATTGLYSTNQTVNFGTLADGDDVMIEYLGSGGFVELNNAFDLSATTARIMFMG